MVLFSNLVPNQHQLLSLWRPGCLYPTGFEFFLVTNRISQTHQEAYWSFQDTVLGKVWELGSKTS
jgi:hypothetical protein